MSDPRKKEERCTAMQVNSQHTNFECKLTTGHTVHVDPRTGTRWGEGPFPRGWNRRWKKNYANRKLHRQTAVAAAAAKKETKKKPKERRDAR